MHRATIWHKTASCCALIRHLSCLSFQSACLQPQCFLCSALSFDIAQPHLLTPHLTQRTHHQTSLISPAGMLQWHILYIPLPQCKGPSNLNNEHLVFLLDWLSLFLGSDLSLTVCHPQPRAHFCQGNHLTLCFHFHCCFQPRPSGSPLL